MNSHTKPCIYVHEIDVGTTYFLVFVMLVGIAEAQFLVLCIRYVIAGHLFDLWYWMDHCRQKDPFGRFEKFL